jgi:hypothetical protein
MLLSPISVRDPVCPTTPVGAERDDRVVQRGGATGRRDRYVSDNQSINPYPTVSWRSATRVDNAINEYFYEYFFLRQMMQGASAGMPYP